MKKACVVWPHHSPERPDQNGAAGKGGAENAGDRQSVGQTT